MATCLTMKDIPKHDIMCDIFGNDKALEKGLIDCKSVDVFDDKLKFLSKKWDSQEEDRSSSPPQFSTYFNTFISLDMRKGMLPPIRKELGLGEELFYNNASECSHFKYKCKILEHNTEKQPSYRNTLQCSWAQAIDIYYKLVVTTSKNIQLCVVDKGPYKLAPLYSHLKMSALAWGKLDPEKKEKTSGKN